MLKKVRRETERYLLREELLEVELLQILRNDNGHAGSSAGVGHLYTVYGHLFNVRIAAKHYLDFTGGDVLSLPSERVADSVDEIIEARLRIRKHYDKVSTCLVSLKQVSCHEPSVSFSERIS